ncbi:MAG: MogA/MoaB family molybdenum cofactor biosynthesis protein [Desulfobacterales bacterium]
MSARHHKKQAPKLVTLGILTISSTRTLSDDKSGNWMAELARKEGHKVVHREVIPDDKAAITKAVSATISQKEPDVMILTGGTGISPRDVTIEAVKPLLSKELSAFGPIFAQLSWEEIDSAALLSRAVAGVVQSTVIFCIPGSLNACKLACKALIFPELGHVVKHVGEP